MIASHLDQRMAVWTERQGEPVLLRTDNFPAPPHDATGHTWHHGNALLLDYTKLGGKAAPAARGVKRFDSGKPAFSEVISNDLGLSDPKPDTKWAKAQRPRPNVLRNYLRSDVKPVAGMETFPPAMKQSVAT